MADNDEVEPTQGSSGADASHRGDSSSDEGFVEGSAEVAAGVGSEGDDSGALDNESLAAADDHDNDIDQSLTADEGKLEPAEELEIDADEAPDALVAEADEAPDDLVAEADDYDGEFNDIVLNSGVDDSDSDEPASGASEGDDQDGDGTDDDALVLEPAGVAASTVNKRDFDQRRARAPKNAPTNKRDVQHTTERTTPVKFVKQSVGELRKVVYPTGQQLMNYFVVVLVFVLFIIAYVSLLDLGIGAAIFKIFA